MLETRRWLVVMGTVVAVMAVVAPADASGDDPFEGLPSKAALVGVNVAKPSPSGCFGQSLRPEAFGNNEVNGPSATRCDRFVPQLSVRAQLWEKRFFGFDRIGDADTQNETNASDVAAFANARCRDNTMRTTGEHRATDVDFAEYRGRTNSGTVKMEC